MKTFKFWTCLVCRFWPKNQAENAHTHTIIKSSLIHRFLSKGKNWKKLSARSPRKLLVLRHSCSPIFKCQTLCQKNSKTSNSVINKNLVEIYFEHFYSISKYNNHTFPILIPYYQNYKYYQSLSLSIQNTLRKIFILHRF